MGTLSATARSGASKHAAYAAVALAVGSTKRHAVDDTPKHGSPPSPPTVGEPLGEPQGLDPAGQPMPVQQEPALKMASLQASSTLHVAADEPEKEALRQACAAPQTAVAKPLKLESRQAYPTVQVAAELPWNLTPDPPPRTLR